MGNELTLVLDNRQLEALHQCYVDLLECWKPEGETEQLLFAHAMDMEKVLKVKVAKEVTKPKLVLKHSETRAFKMLWQMMDISGTYQQYLIQKVTGDADRWLQQPQLKMAMEKPLG